MKKRKVMQAEVLADRKVLTHEEWLNVRRQGIGGSEAGAILGLSPFSSAFSVYAEKIGVKKADEANEAMRIGTDLEPYVAQRFMEATGKRVVNCNYVLTNPNYKFMLADVDRLVVGENAGLECKTTSAFNKTNFSKADIPHHYYIQCVHYMAVTGAEKWYIAILVLGVGFYYFCIDRNEEEVQALIELERRFWFDNVQSYVEPEVDGKKETTAVLNDMYMPVEGKRIDLMPFRETLDKYSEVQKKIDELEQEKEMLKQEIQVYMANNTEGFTDGYKVTWREQERSTVDTKRLKAECPEIYDRFLKKSYSRPFKITQTESN